MDGIATVPEKRKLLGGMIALSHGLGMSVVAEGAEMATEVDLLAAFDCDFVQRLRLPLRLSQPSKRLWWRPT